MTIFHIEIPGTWKILLEKLQEKQNCHSNYSLQEMILPELVQVFFQGCLKNLSTPSALPFKSFESCFSPFSFHKGLSGLTLGKKKEVCLSCCPPPSLCPPPLSCFHLVYLPLVHPYSTNTHITDASTKLFLIHIETRDLTGCLSLGCGQEVQEDPGN